MAKADAAGELAQLILGDGGHDGKPQLSVLVQRIDVVILEEDRNPGGQQLAGEGDGIQRIAGKAGDLLGDDQIEGPGLGVLDHAVKILPLAGRDAGEPLVGIAGDIVPGGVLANEILVISHLIAQ